MSRRFEIESHIGFGTNYSEGPLISGLVERIDSQEDLAGSRWAGLIS